MEVLNRCYVVYNNVVIWSYVIFGQITFAVGFIVERACHLVMSFSKFIDLQRQRSLSFVWNERVLINVIS